LASALALARQDLDKGIAAFVAFLLSDEATFSCLVLAWA
jgi:hypothetical protein